MNQERFTRIEPVPKDRLRQPMRPDTKAIKTVALHHFPVIKVEEDRGLTQECFLDLPPGIIQM